MGLRKQNIPFGIVIELSPDSTGMAASFTAKYRLQGDSGAWTTLPGTFQELKPGTYELMSTFTTVGLYDVLLESSEDGVDSNSCVIAIGKASVDDVYDALTAAATEITAIKTKVNTLDAAEIASIKTGVNDTLALLNEVNTMIGDTSLESVTSLKELLISIGQSEDAQTGLINALNNVSNGVKTILLGKDQFLADGTTPNPHYQATNVELKQLVTTSTEQLKADLEAAKTAVIADAQATRDLLKLKLDGIKTVVDANSALLGDASVGLAAIRAALATVETNTSGGTTTIINALNDADHGLAVLKAQTVSILSAINGVDTKVTAIRADVSAIKAAGGSSKKISISM